MVGAGAVVTHDVPDHALVVEVAARQIGWVCTCGTTLRFKQTYSKCGYCQNEYRLVDDKIEVIREN